MCKEAGNALYRNDGGSGFVDVASSLNAAGRGWGMGAVSADYDNDGDADPLRHQPAREYTLPQ